MKKKFDIVFFTNQPAFYKINLYNEVSKSRRILVIFLGTIENGRTKDFITGNMNFEYLFINKIKCEKRNKLRSCFKLIKILKSIEYDLMITMGWSYIEDFIIPFISSKRKNGLVCESSIYESNLDNWKKYLKKLICLRMKYAFVSGQPHKEILEKLNFKGKIVITGGVGLFNKNKIERKKVENSKKEFKYLCVARLIPVKNLEFLINVFNKNRKNLTIAGQGILEEKLKKIAKENIRFTGHIPNKEIGKLYQEHDIFILSSKSETWGLVVEEALYNRLPVLVSDKVGSNIDLVENYNSGEIFKFDNENDLNKKIKKMENNYDYYKENTKKINFKERDKKQIEAYTGEI